jgi:tetratricopeptide (TPR) repeat protein
MFVFWVYASTKETFEEAYSGIADRLRLRGRDNSKIRVTKLVCDWLANEENGQWLMILDNVDDVEVFHPRKANSGSTRFSAQTEPPLEEFIPKSGNGNVLVTSRSMEAAEMLTGDLDNIYQVPVMDENQALQLLRQKLNKVGNEEGAAELVRALDCIPLAITQAAAYIRRLNGRSISSYLREFRRSDEKKVELLGRRAGDLRRNETASKTVLTTWQITFEQISRERPSAADLLSFMSFFNPQGIPESALCRYKHLKEEDESELGNDLEVLCGYSMVTETMAEAEKDNAFEMHALVHFCTRHWRSPFKEKANDDNKSNDGIRYWKQKFLQVMSEEFPSGEFQSWAICQKLSPHIESIIRDEPKDKEDAQAWTHLLTNAGRYQCKKGSYQTAERMLRSAKAVRESAIGKEHPDTLAVVNYLGVILEKQSKYEEAAEMNRQAFEGRKRVLGNDATETLESLSNLALTLHGQAKYTDAEALNRLALEKREKIYGKEHACVIESVNNLASTLRHQAKSKYDEAVRLSIRAFEWRQQNLGKEHPDTVESLSSLSLALMHQGSIDDAAKLSLEALSRSRLVLGETHPDTLINMSHFALVLLKQDKASEAEKLTQEALRGIEAGLGTSNIDTLTVIHTLARVSLVLENYPKAEELYRRALGGFEEQLGPHHPHTLHALNNLAMVLRRLTRYDDAAALYQRAITGFTECFDTTHPDTLIAKTNLASVLQKQGNLDEAETITRDALHGFEESLGPNHPTTLQCLSNLAELLATRENYGESEELGRKATEGFKKELGVKNHKTLRCISRLAHLLHNQQRYHEAWELYETACSGYKTSALDNKASRTCFERFGYLQEEMKTRNLAVPAKRRSPPWADEYEEGERSSKRRKPNIGSKAGTPLWQTFASWVFGWVVFAKQTPGR